MHATCFIHLKLDLITLKHRVKYTNYKAPSFLSPRYRCSRLQFVSRHSKCMLCSYSERPSFASI